MYEAENKMDGLYFYFPCAVDIHHNLNNLKAPKFYSHVSFGSVRSSRRAKHSGQIITRWTLTSICSGALSILMRWNILSVRLMRNNQGVPPSIRRGNVALMQRCGEKCDLALGCGVFLVRLW